ncbi:MAG: hypothetical protein IIX77_04855 [Oscillospiraceae bacterium]|nr:hypothetical protein [Oscillospiraceae bacterium]
MERQRTYLACKQERHFPEKAIRLAAGGFIFANAAFLAARFIKRARLAANIANLSQTAIYFARKW